MDRLVRLFNGGVVKDNGEFENMDEDVELFDTRPSLKDVLDRVTTKFACGVDEVTLRGRFDCGKARSHYVLMKLSSECHWRQYKEIVDNANVVCLEVVVDICRVVEPNRVDENVDVDHVVIENLSQQSTISQLPTVPSGETQPNSSSPVPSSPHFDLAVASDDFGNDTFEVDEENSDDDEISLGSEDADLDEVVVEDACEDDVGDGVETEELDEEAPQPSSGQHDDDRFNYTERELQLLKEVHVELPSVANAKDISMCHKAVCDSQFVEMGGIIDMENPQIRKGMKFSTFEELQFFLADYSVRVFRPFTVVHSDQKLRYDVMCKQGCMWRVWCRLIRGTGQWKITRVVQPHTCRSAKPKQEHAQCTARYLGRRILGIIYKDSDTSVPSLVESIFAFSGFRVKYSKAWRAKQHAMSVLWGDWKESYAKVPRVLNAMAHFNPGIRWFPYSSGVMLHDKGIYKHVLQRVFWCFPQCSIAFQYCRPVILVDATFLTGKYKGTLMMAVAVDPESQLVPLAFALAEGENDSSWSWFMGLVRRYVLGPSRQVCMISDRHHGLLKCVGDHMDGYPPLVHRWCMRHFAANMWRRQKNKEVIGKLKVLCSVRTVQAFEEKHEDLVKDLNERAKEWLDNEMEDKNKWALAFDEGGKRYGIMTTNNSEALNNVFKGIRSRPVAGIVEYSFQKCNEYFVNRWQRARASLDNGDRLGVIADEHFAEAEELSVHQIGEPYGPERMVYSVRGAGGTTIGGESHGGRNYRVDLKAGECSCTIPHLIHLPCSHLITACKARGLNYMSHTYMSPLYGRENTLKIWESSFEPYLDPTQWPPYVGFEYVPDSNLKKVGKGRRKTKRLKGDMDASQGRFVADFTLGDFDAEKTKNRCSKCHKFIKDCKCRPEKPKKKKSENQIVATQVSEYRYNC